MGENALGTEGVRFDLSFMYSGVDDPRIGEDLDKLEKLAKSFERKYRGKLATKLGRALRDLSKIDELSNKIFVYLFLCQSVNLKDEKTLKRMQSAETRSEAISGKYMTFFDIEVIALPNETIEALAAADPFVRKHLPCIGDIRRYKAHTLSEEVESALTKRGSLGPSSWAEFFDEVEADLVFEYGGKNYTVEEILNLMSEHEDPKVRAEVLKVVNDGMGGPFAKYSAQTLNMIRRGRRVENIERGYPHPMSSRNTANKIPDEVVIALHQAIGKAAPPLVKRFYQLKARLLGLDKLKWSDRNAKLKLPGEKRLIPFEEALRIVLKAYKSFSPTLARLARQSVKAKRIDAPAIVGKRSGAFNYSVVLPGGRPVSFTFLNYLGSTRDVMTLAHELGHGVHGMLAGAAQGPLMARAPIAYAETASVFGEATTFNDLRRTTTDKRELLALLLSKIDDMMNTAVRQIGFSNFEQRIHAVEGRLSPEDFSRIWLETLKELYGEDGEVFTYENVGFLWAYISHFHRPFYVYGYAFGELLVQSLYAKREELGDRFEPLYLEMLRAGGTKDAIELLEPFDLDPRDLDFWERGIEISLGKMIDEAEALAHELGLA